MAEPRGAKVRRSYRPGVEALEALRLLSSATQTLPPLTVDVHPGGLNAVPLPDLAAPTPTQQAWDEALAHSDLNDIFGLLSGPTGPVVVSPTKARTVSSEADIEAGLVQLNRYLSRSWYRAGVPVQMHDDCTQAVYMTLLQNLGRDKFDGLLTDIGQTGIKDVLSRETPEGPDFFRAIDTVKKRAQREKTYQPIDTIDVASTSTGEDARALWRNALQEAIDQSLTPREASLVYDTLMGKTPAEIASAWGVAPKTVSNEKTRAIQKLREALTADLAD